MTAPQLPVRSAKAHDLAHRLSRRDGRPIHVIVEDAPSEYAQRHPDENAANFLRRMRAIGGFEYDAVEELEAAVDGNRTPHRGIDL